MTSIFMKILERERESTSRAGSHTHHPRYTTIVKLLQIGFTMKKESLKKKKKSQDEEQKSENIDGET